MIHQGTRVDVGVTESSAPPDSVVAAQSGGTTAADSVKVVAQNNILISPAI